MRPILFVVGTRPEAIKLAPVIRECQKRGLPHVVRCTGQHDVSRIFEYFDIDRDEPDFIGVGHAIDSLCEVIDRKDPCCVVAQGDTFSVMAAAQAAFYEKTPFVHVEAGLRSGSLKAPWPEEYIRRCVSIGTALHCCPTQRAADNIMFEKHNGDVVVTGNTGIDALLWAASQEDEANRAEFIFQKRMKAADEGMVLITAHRRENQDGGIARVCTAVSKLAEQFPKVLFFWPSHPNPAVQEAMSAHPSWPRNVAISDAIGYPSMVSALKSCTLVLTDSGGLQEEAPTFKKPVVVLREVTERQELIEAGGGVLVGTDIDKIVSETSRLLSDGFYYAQYQVECNPYGDGTAARTTVDAIERRFA